MSLTVTGEIRSGPGWVNRIGKGKEGNVKRFWTALAIAAVIGAALFLLAAADAGASRTLSAAFCM
jgi:hypothetical protein